MKKLFVASALAFAAVAGAATAVQGEDAPPPWAYGFPTPVPPGTPPAAPNPAQVLDNTTLHTLPGSKVSFTRAQIANRYAPADWFPEDHPMMPDVVALGSLRSGDECFQRNAHFVRRFLSLSERDQFAPKTALITIGAIAVLYFSLSERLWTVKAGEDAPMSAKWVAALVLLSWAGVIMGGRLISYV